MARVLIVDAHSVIFSWPELLRLHKQRMILAREALIRLLTEYQDITGVRVVAVFDGQGPKYSETTEPGGIQVFYSAKGKTADSMIERLVAKYAKEHDITVATNDSLEQQTASSFGAVCVGTEFLGSMLEDARTLFQQELKRHRRKL